MFNKMKNIYFMFDKIKKKVYFIFDKIKTHFFSIKSKDAYFMFYNFLFENRTFYEIMCKNTFEPDRPQSTIQNGACAARFEDTCCLTVNTTHSTATHGRTMPVALNKQYVLS